MQLNHWSGRSVALASSKDKVLAFANVWDNFIRSGAAIWPSPEFVQNFYQTVVLNLTDRQPRITDPYALAGEGVRPPINQSCHEDANLS